jgi:hypothetical protein
MEEENTTTPANLARPFFFSILCMVVFVYSGFFIVFFITAMIFHNWITRVLNDYLPERDIKASDVLFATITGILLYSLTFCAAILLWKQKRTGLYIYVLSSILISLIPFLFGIGNIISVLVFAALIVSFTPFYRRLN